MATNSRPARKAQRASAPHSADDVVSATQAAIASVRTKTVDFSFNELFDMHENAELKINPEYQRLFRWSEEKQSQFIESLILELPIPPIYVIEEEGGIYELIDGLQRFSSYLHLRGKLKTKDGVLQPPLTLDGCDIVRELNGLLYDELPSALQIRLKRMSVPVQVLRRESDRRLRYHMFKRLNTGGEPLSNQEVRNATIRLLGERFNKFLQTLATEPAYTACVDIMTPQAKEQMQREECVLRFFAFKNDFDSYRKLITPFLDSFMERMSDEAAVPAPSFDYTAEAHVFRTTFGLFAATTKDQTFSTVSRGLTLGNQFSQAHFDSLTLGVQKHLKSLAVLDGPRKTEFGKQILALKKDTQFKASTTGGGKNYQAAYAKNIKFVEERIGKWLATI